MDENILCTCSYCDYTTNRKFNLKRHEISKHSKKIMEDIKKSSDEKNIPITNTTTNIVVNEIKKDDGIYYCSKCGKKYLTLKSFNNHEKKCIGIDILTCPKCLIKFTNSSHKSRHIKRNNCKAKLIIEKHRTISTQTDGNFDEAVNNKLLNLIMEKDKRIEILNKQIDDSIIKINEVIITPELNKFTSLTLNDIIITSRENDYFINAILLCHAGSKNFNEWYKLNSTKELIEEYTKLNIYNVIDKKSNKIIWIHPDLACNLAQWISNSFYLQICKWIKTMITKCDYYSFGKIIQEKDQRIKLLENTYVKKHNRVNYKEKNVIYMLSTKDYKDSRIYIIGKAINLSNRLSQYNKTIDHDVIYYKECKNEEYMNFIEKAVLNKLDKYREIANRDRFILPLENDITLFTNIIESIINLF